MRSRLVLLSSTILALFLARKDYEKQNLLRWQYHSTNSVHTFGGTTKTCTLALP
jgi:hypothetical protein